MIEDAFDRVSAYKFLRPAYRQRIRAEIWSFSAGTKSLGRKSFRDFTLMYSASCPPSPQGQRAPREDILVRLPSLRKSKWRVTVLQGWVGRVEQVMADRFLAVLSDATSSLNPQEQIELDLREVSESDIPLLACGATFYWSIGYRDTPGGQRERISTLRFARHPRLKETDMRPIFSHADGLAAFLEK